jgi:ABC-type maltose transport system permease subunit
LFKVLSERQTLPSLTRNKNGGFSIFLTSRPLSNSTIVYEVLFHSFVGGFWAFVVESALLKQSEYKK